MENKLHPEFKILWVKALRSGKYKQGKCNLYKDGKYCCLGVAGLLRGLSNDQMFEKSSVYNDDEYFLSTPELTQDQRMKLAMMNDGTINQNEKSFTDIADYIEENL